MWITRRKTMDLAAKGQIVPDRSLLKTPEQIKAIQESADLNTAVLDHVAAHIRKGMSTEEIDRLVYDYTTQHGGIPAPLNYQGFPKSVCTSVNNVVCHGIPDENEILKEGDIINVDVSTILNGYYSDASRMFTIGQISPEAEKIVRVTKECVELGLKAAKHGDIWEISLMPSVPMPGRMAFLSWKISAAMESAWNFMKILMSAM